MHLCGVVLLVTIHQQTYKGLRGKYQVFPNFLFLSYLSLSNFQLFLKDLHNSFLVETLKFKS